MDFFSVASGSSGNCICLGSDQCHVMIDAGISGKRIEEGMNTYDYTTSDMDGVLITHEHSTGLGRDRAQIRTADLCDKGDGRCHPAIIIGWKDRSVFISCDRGGQDLFHWKSGDLSYVDLTRCSRSGRLSCLRWQTSCGRCDRSGLL